MTSSSFGEHDTDAASLQGLLARQKAAATRAMNPDRATRDERLRKLEANDDYLFCTKIDIYPEVLPLWDGKKLVRG